MVAPGTIFSRKCFKSFFGTRKGIQLRGTLLSKVSNMAVLIIFIFRNNFKLDKKPIRLSQHMLKQHMTHKLALKNKCKGVIVVRINYRFIGNLLFDQFKKINIIFNSTLKKSVSFHINNNGTFLIIRSRDRSLSKKRK